MNKFVDRMAETFFETHYKRPNAWRSLNATTKKQFRASMRAALDAIQAFQDAAMRTAVLQERKRCAEIARCMNTYGRSDWDSGYCDACSDIAGAIEKQP